MPYTTQYRPSPRPRVAALAILLALGVIAGGRATAGADAIDTNRQWEALPAPGDDGGRTTLAAAAQALRDLPVTLAGVRLDGTTLNALAATPADEPLLRAVRERLGRPVDLTDLLYFLDDVAAARGRLDSVDVHSGRARRAGILLHPDGVFGDTPRRYGGRRLEIRPPPNPPDLEPAPDGAPPGPRWTARYPNPADEAARLQALVDAGAAGFASRLRSLMAQCRDQGAEAYLYSTVRRRERGYLMYGAFILARARGPEAVARRAAELERLNAGWGLDIPIRWQTDDGWRATKEAARRMAEAYNVVYATRSGARHSNHYDGDAADLVVVDLPRRLTLAAPDGARRTFDLSAPEESRDLDLTPRLIDWVERHFDLRKLRSDYPHWTDQRGG
ncbi:hypothetical protein ACEZHJ_02610 [Arhodomonas sp. KWT2]